MAPSLSIIHETLFPVNCLLDGTRLDLEKEEEYVTLKKAMPFVLDVDSHCNSTL